MALSIFSARREKEKQKRSRRAFLGVVNDAAFLPAHQVPPANRSMFKSSLRNKETWPAPKLSGLDNVESALDRDHISQRVKYGAEHPNPMTARFNVKVPNAPPNLSFRRRNKLVSMDYKADYSPEVPELSLPGRSGSSRGCYTASPETCSTAATPSIFRGVSPISLASPSPVPVQQLIPPTPGARAAKPGIDHLQFNKDRIAQWFRNIDRDDSGHISQREFIVYLRQHPDFLHLLYRVSGGTEQWLQDTDVERARKVHAQISRIKEILAEVDTDGSGAMDWAEFVDFFKRCGMLLEYKTRGDLNHTGLCDATLEAQEAEEKRLDNIQMIGKASRFQTFVATDSMKAAFADDLQHVRKAYLEGVADIDEDCEVLDYEDD